MKIFYSLVSLYKTYIRMKFSKMLAAITQVLNQDSDTQVDVCMTSEMARRIELWTDTVSG